MGKNLYIKKVKSPGLKKEVVRIGTDYTFRGNSFIEIDNFSKSVVSAPKIKRGVVYKIGSLRKVR